MITISDKILTLEEAKAAVRVTWSEDDDVLQALIDAIPDYLEITTGYKPIDGNHSPLAKTVAKFIMLKWFNIGANDMHESLQRAIDNMLAALTATVKR